MERRLLAGGGDGGGVEPGDLDAGHRLRLFPCLGPAVAAARAARGGRPVHLVLPQPAAAGAVDLRLQPAAGVSRLQRAAGQPFQRWVDRHGAERGRLHRRDPSRRPAGGGQGAVGGGQGAGHRLSRRAVADRDSPGPAGGAADSGQRIHHHRQAHLAGVGDLAVGDSPGGAAALHPELPGDGDHAGGGLLLRAHCHRLQLPAAQAGAASGRYPAQAQVRRRWRVA
ncbi:hypothetical protein D3C85_724190 [compost metagenome]